MLHAPKKCKLRPVCILMQQSKHLVSRHCLQTDNVNLFCTSCSLCRSAHTTRGHSVTPPCPVLREDVCSGAATVFEDPVIKSSYTLGSVLLSTAIVAFSV